MQIKRILQFLLRHEYLIWILCLCAILRLPSLLEPYWYGDEGIYLTLGNGVRHGLQLYRDIHDNKPPVIYLLAALTGSVFWFRFLLLLWNSAAIIAFERLSRILFSEEDADKTVRIAGVHFPQIRWTTIATLLFAVTPFFAEGAIANGEIFMIMPTIVAMLLLWTSLKRSTSRLLYPLLAGLCLSLAFLIKIPSLFDAVAAGFFFFFLIPLTEYIRTKKLSSIQHYLLPLVAFSLAFLSPILLSIGYYSLLGVGKQYIAAAFAQNIGYLSSWSTGTHQASNLGSTGLKSRAILLSIGSFLSLLFFKRNGKVLTFLGIWFFFSLFGALLSERPYPHYLIQVIPPLVLLLVQILAYLARREFQWIRLGTGMVCLAIFLISLVKIQFWYYPLLPYYENYLSFVAGKKSKEEYLSYFDPRLVNMYKTAAFLQRATSANDRIFIWGDDPSLYALSRRLPPGRYTSSYHIIDFHGQEETIQAIERNTPRYIVVNTAYSSAYPELASILAADYIRTYEFSPFTIYKYVTH